MPEGLSIPHHMIEGATNKDPVHQLRHLHRKQRLCNAVVVLNSIKREKRRHNLRNIDRVQYICHGDTTGRCMDKLSSGAVAVDEETSCVVVFVYSGTKAAGEWVEEVQSARK